MLAAANPSSVGTQSWTERRGQIGEHSADRGRAAGKQVEQECSGLAEPGMQPDDEIAGLLGNFVRDDRERRNLVRGSAQRDYGGAKHAQNRAGKRCNDDPGKGGHAN